MVVKIIELVGVSKKSYEDAVMTAVARTSKTVKNITGVDVIGQSAKVVKGKVTEFRANLKVAFIVE
jgi:flavin-binding protein dodecin